MRRAVDSLARWMREELLPVVRGYLSWIPVLATWIGLTGLFFAAVWLAWVLFQVAGTKGYGD